LHPGVEFRPVVDKLNKLLADPPLGHIAFLALALGGLVWVHSGGLSADGYVAGVGASAGLLAVGHGIRHGRKS
jgi:hypothetical protein